MTGDSTAWRLIDSGPCNAAWNMAVDEALLISAGKGQAPPTLRFYSWETPSLSIGSFQNTAELDMEAIRRRDIPLVRRPTGGRAVLHDEELTYSVAAPIPSPTFPPDILGSYKVIGSCFIGALRKLGIDAKLVPVEKGRATHKHKGMKDPLCFSSPSWYEVVAGGKKLIGSAQRRLKDSFLQQGSLLMKLDIPGLMALLKFEDEPSREAAYRVLCSKMTAVHEHDKSLSRIGLKEAIKRSFSSTLGVEIEPGELSGPEMELALGLYEDKYSRDGWNIERRV